MYCVIAYIFKTLLDIPQLPLTPACLHSLLEEFISPLYYSTAAPALNTFLNHARQLRNSTVKLSPPTIVKKILVLAKGPGFIYDPYEVMLLLEVIYFCLCFVCLLISLSLILFFSSHH